MSGSIQMRSSLGQRRSPLQFRRLLQSLLPLALVCGLLVSPALAQDHVVSGTVTDASSGDPLPGATVLLTGTTIGTTTNVNGQYDLALPDGDGELRFSFVGYEVEFIPVEGREVINVALEPATLTGAELVVVGYRVQQRQDLTGSVEVVDVQRVAELPSGQITRQLQGQASGVNVISTGQPGTAPLINIRGMNTFGNNQPLFVVDGVPTTNINDLNPSDVETMQVLKDAGAASIYGARASNGVVLITTQRGRGDITVSYDAQAGYQVPNRDNVWNILSPQDMAQLKWMSWANSGIPSGTPDPQYGNFSPGGTPILPDYILPSGRMEDEIDESTYFVDPFYTDPNMLQNFNQIVRANHAGTDWYSEIFKPAPMIQNNITVSGGNDLGQFLFSLGQLNHQGTANRTYNQRYTLRANTLFNITESFRVGENLSISLTDNPTIDLLGDPEGTAISHSYRQQPIIPVYDIAGNFGGSAGAHMGNALNPVAILERTQNNTGEGRRIFGNVYAEFDFLNNFMLRSSFGGELASSNWTWFNFPSYENAENATANRYGEGSWNGRQWTWTTTLNSRHQVGGHLFEFVAGTEAYRNFGRQVQGTATGYFSFDPLFTNLSSAADPSSGQSWSYADAIMSFIGRADYNYDQKYLLSFTIRRDGSSRFVDEQWGTFPGFTAGWRISEEPFMQNVDWLTDLKLRGGFGVMGNQINVDAANAYTLFAANPQNSFYPINGSNTTVEQGFRQSRIGNPAARWERTEDFNVGFDVALFGGQLEATADYYQKNVKDLLFQLQLPATAGAATPPFQNVASMKNEGFDLSVRHGTHIGDLRLNSRLTFTSYNNRIVEIAEGLEYFDARSTRIGNVIRNQKAAPIPSFFGYDIIGFWQNEDEINQANEAAGGTYQQDAGVGRFRYRDVDGDGRITADDRTFLGSPHPDFTYGLNIGLGYRAFDFNVFAYGVQGAELWNQVRWWTDFYSNFQGAKSHTALYDSWTPDNRNAKAPIQENDSNFSTSNVPNSYYVEDGSYLRIKNLQVGYTLPGRLASQIGMRHMRVYFQANDVFTITGYSGLDPEIGGSSAAFGVEEGAYATPQSFTMGVNLTL